MIKKILTILLLFTLLFHISALANDGGARLDDDKYLSVDVKFDSLEAEIGGEFSFSVTLVNKSKDKINGISVKQIFMSYYYNFYEDIEKQLCDISLLPGEKTTFNIKTKVPTCLIYYYKDGSYYADLNLILKFDLNPVDEKDGYDIRHWFYENKSINTPIKISNVYDGAEYINLELLEEETTYYFPDHQSYEYHQYEGEQSSSINNKIVLTNLSQKKISELFIGDIEGLSRENKALYELDAGENINVSVISNFFIIPENITEKLSYTYRVIFKVGNIYYTSKLEKEYPTQLLTCPKLDITIDQDTAIITNLSSTDIHKLYIDLNCEDTYDIKLNKNYNEQNIISLLKKDTKVEIPYLGEKTEIKDYVVGLIRDGKLYCWRADNVDKIPYDNDEYSYLYYHIEEIMIAPSCTPIPSPSPTLASTQTPAPTPTKEVTPKPTQVIEVTNITKESSMPLWVWMVLALTSICTGVIIWRFRQTNKKKVNRFDD